MRPEIKQAKKQGLNWQALIIEEAQTEIKILVRDGVLQGAPFLTVKKKVVAVIDRAVKEIANEELKKSAQSQLYAFATRAYRLFVNSIGGINAIPAIAASIKTTKQMQRTTATSLRKPIQVFGQRIIREYLPQGVANQEYAEVYAKRVTDAITQLSEQQATSDFDSRMSLRASAEILVRYEKAVDMIEGLRQRGVRFVVSSIHANCSKRCQQWQGGNYTTDNTHAEFDGKQFRPLSDATEIFDVTKSGKVWRNGHITGFGCRHTLTEYRPGMNPPQVSAAQVEKSRRIDKRLRELELVVRKWKERAVLMKGVNKPEYDKARSKALFWNSEYIRFAKENKVAYYPSRTRIL